jgi:hypothetical protein
MFARYLHKLRSASFDLGKHPILGQWLRRNGVRTRKATTKYTAGTFRGLNTSKRGIRLLRWPGELGHCSPPSGLQNLLAELEGSEQRLGSKGTHRTRLILFDTGLKP